MLTTRFKQNYVVSPVLFIVRISGVRVREMLNIVADVVAKLVWNARFQGNRRDVFLLLYDRVGDAAGWLLSAENFFRRDPSTGILVGVFYSITFPAGFRSWPCS